LWIRPEALKGTSLGYASVLPANIGLVWKKLVRDKHLLRKFVNTDKDSFVTLGPGVNIVKKYLFSWKARPLI